MQVFDELDLDAVLVTSGTNRRYLTGFSAEDHAPDESSGVVVLMRDRTTLFTSPTNLPWARAEKRSHVEVQPAPRPWTSTLADYLRQRQVNRLGFEDRTTTFADYRCLHQALPEVELVPVGARVDARRRIKTDDEVKSLESALRITDDAFGNVSEQIRPGMTEIEVADAIREALRDLGSEGEAFPTIVASGPNAAKPHHSPGRRSIVEGEPIIIDMGARVDGYRGDLTRTVWTGRPSPRLGTMYRLVLEAQLAAIAAVREGVAARAVDTAARMVFASAGMEDAVLHSVGHGVGLRIHEAPSLSQASTDVLQAGNVITIEPGLYVAEWGGVRIEDVLLVERNGSRNLTRSSKHPPT